MSNNVTIEVLDRDGRPVRGTNVQIFVSGILSGGIIDERTDSSGHAEFTTTGDYESSRRFTVTVKNQRFGPFKMGGGAFTVTLA